jgi:hypothetical protein
MVVSNLSVWSLTADLTDYIVAAFFEQPRMDSSALIRAKLPDGQLHHWLFTNRQYVTISLEDYEKFKKAAKLRGGAYAMELCEFTVEQVMANGDLVLFHWRRLADESGKGGRIILSHREGYWTVIQKLGGWDATPNQATASDAT